MATCKSKEGEAEQKRKKTKREVENIRYKRYIEGEKGIGLEEGRK